jgi:hypothetical protein
MVFVQHNDEFQLVMLIIVYSLDLVILVMVIFQYREYLQDQNLDANELDFHHLEVLQVLNEVYQIKKSREKREIEIISRIFILLDDVF